MQSKVALKLYKEFRQKLENQSKTIALSQHTNSRYPVRPTHHRFSQGAELTQRVTHPGGAYV